jgi:hypothetical protein
VVILKRSEVTVTGEGGLRNTQMRSGLGSGVPEKHRSGPSGQVSGQGSQRHRTQHAFRTLRPLSEICSVCSIQQYLFLSPANRVLISSMQGLEQTGEGKKNSLQIWATVDGQRLCRVNACVHIIKEEKDVTRQRAW